MVLTELLAGLIEWAGAMVGAHGFKAGLIASAAVVAYHAHSILAFLQGAVRAVRIGAIGGGLVALALIVGVAMGWLSIGGLPAVPLPFLIL